MGNCNLHKGINKVEIEIENLLQPGLYSISPGIHLIDGLSLDYVDNVLDFEVLKISEGKEEDYLLNWNSGMIRLNSNGKFMVKREFIPLASPDINDQDISEVIRVLKSGMLVQGPEVELLENKIASLVGVKYCIAASNGTATLHLCLVALDVGPGDEVIVPAFSYVATANVVELVGATSVFVDIDIDSSILHRVILKRQLLRKRGLL